MRNIKIVILLIMALALLAAGCSAGAEEKNGNLKEGENMETEKILTVDELIS